MNHAPLHQRAFNRSLELLSDAVGHWQLRRIGVQLGEGVRTMGLPIVSRHAESSIELGARVVLCSASRWTALGVAHPVVLRTLRTGARLRIGGATGISGGSICAAVAVDIGERCLIGADVLISDTDFHPVEPVGRHGNANWAEIGCRPVRIGNNVFIGSRAVILKGVDIGDGSVIGAGAVVTRSVPANSIAAGNPARVIRTL